jgi:GDP-4-dehydro-6-deoxy-D-mannose reductase
VPGPSLITGATGFAGGHLLERLIADGETVHAWGHTAQGLSSDTAAAGLSRRSAEGAKADPVPWRSVDLLDRAAVREALDAARPSVIYHCAGFAHLQDAWRQPARALRVNVLGTHHLFEAVRDLGLTCRILITGSAQVYRPCTTDITEDAAIGPDNPYGISKLAQEMMAAASPIPAWLVRPFNHAGPRQSPAYATSAFAHQIAEIEAGRRDPVIHVGNLDARRDITDVRDTVRAYHAIVVRGQPGRPYNVCSGRAHTMRHLLDLLLSLARVRVRVEIDAARLRPSDNPLILGSHARLTADTGWTPVIPIEQTLADLLEHWRRATAV